MNQFNWQRAPNTEERQIMVESSRSDVAKTLHDLIDDPISPVMTYQQIVNFIIGDMGSAVEINAKQITAILIAKGLVQCEKIKFKVETVHPGGL
ncbi:hypothetical protein [Arsenophonus endosymbiont of Aleurodicus floccissimus]|uniref:hypothetical protein n=1 Tax=Arsenophonus endosymbiont of Aleurodicus floccissimus TaxID=2152761 RepID=UPI000E6B291D|nr:hypothetical protein [Arsenophonus endosymbiont of Aleurodicus floccissimus]